MRFLKHSALCLLVGSLPGLAIAADGGFTGDFEGTGRACSGALYVHTDTIEWNSTYSVCKPTHYEVLEKSTGDESQRIAFLLKNPGRRCRFKVVEIEQASRYGWNVSGFQSLAGFQNRHLPGWRNSPLPERQVLSCPMTGPD